MKLFVEPGLLWTTFRPGEAIEAEEGEIVENLLLFLMTELVEEEFVSLLLEEAEFIIFPREMFLNNFESMKGSWSTFSFVL